MKGIALAACRAGHVQCLCTQGGDVADREACLLAAQVAQHAQEGPPLLRRPASSGPARCAAPKQASRVRACLHAALASLKQRALCCKLTRCCPLHSPHRAQEAEQVQRTAAARNGRGSPVGRVAGEPASPLRVASPDQELLLRAGVGEGQAPRGCSGHENKSQQPVMQAGLHIGVECMDAAMSHLERSPWSSSAHLCGRCTGPPFWAMTAACMHHDRAQ